MAAAPVLPASENASLSEGARIVNTFIAPSKTFTDLRHNASWWAPFLLMAVVSTALVYTAGQKIGFRKIVETPDAVTAQAASAAGTTPSRSA